MRIKRWLILLKFFQTYITHIYILLSGVESLDTLHLPCFSAEAHPEPLQTSKRE